MAIIHQQPNSLSLSGNMKKFIMSSGGMISFILKQGNTTLLEASYEPGPDNRVTVDVSDIIVAQLAYSIKSDNFYQQDQLVKIFTAIIDGTEISFRVIRSGVANLSDTATNWLTGNFLTWQPQNKEVTYYSPEWITYYANEVGTLKLKAYFDDETEQILTLGNMSATRAYTANVQYANVAGLLGGKYPMYYEVYVENAAGDTITYTQRYLYSKPKSEQEQWFLFENSLGGLDTVRASGDTDFEGAHEHKISHLDDVATEYDVDTTRSYNKSTGYLNDYERRWLLDFFPSRSKYMYVAAALRSIVVTASDVQYSASDLPSAYNFTYQFAQKNTLLNLVRHDSMPDSITLPDIESPDFSLPPRLSEYPRVPLHEGVILPAFDPYNPDPTVTTVGNILAAAVAKVIESIEAGEGGGELVDILRVEDTADPSDFNVFSAARALIEVHEAIKVKGADYFLSKTKTDAAAALIKFLGGAQFGEFIPGMFGGKGASIDADGNIEAASLMLRSFLEVPEIRFNLQTYIGEESILGTSGLIASVEQLDDRLYQLNMKLEEGQGIEFIPGDLARGIFYHGTGFATSHLIINEVGTTFIKATLAHDSDVPTPWNMPPQPFMRIARCGHSGPDHPERQRFVILSSSAGGMQVWDGCTTFLNGTIVAEISAEQAFKNKYGPLPLRPGLPYIYAAGLVVEDIIRVDYQGVPVKQVYDRGPWQTGVTYFNDETRGTDDVWHLGCRWRCFSSSTTEEPSWSSASWIMIEGRSDAWMEFELSWAGALHGRFQNEEITPFVLIGNSDVSHEIEEQQWSWTRVSGDPVADGIWNAQHAGMRVLPLSYADCGPLWSRQNSIRFNCTAIYPSSVLNQITSYLEI